MYYLINLSSDFVQTYKSIYSQASGWVCSILVFLSTFLGESRYLLQYVVFAAIVDLAAACIKSRIVSKKGIESHGLFLFVVKIVVYFIAFLLVTSIDKALMVDSFWITRVLTSVILLAEAVSFFANMAISFPKIKIFRFMGRLLISEIAKKGGIEEEKLIEITQEITKDLKDYKEEEEDKKESI